MKRKPKSGRFAKEVERSGVIFSAVRTEPLASWMTDPSQLPKAPPKPRNESNRQRRT
jgi:hypothetical protein